MSRKLPLTTGLCGAGLHRRGRTVRGSNFGQLQDIEVTSRYRGKSCTLGCRATPGVCSHSCQQHFRRMPAVQGKHYPREWLPLGRLRVQLKAEDGTLHNSEVPDRES